MTSKSLAALAAAAVLLLAGPGCIVTSATYQMKTKEADTLREAMASLSREKAKLAEENAALSKQVAACKDAGAALSARLAEKDAREQECRAELRSPKGPNTTWLRQEGPDGRLRGDEGPAQHPQVP